MRTQILTVADIDKAVALLQTGEIVAFPTETVYGLGAPIFNQKAIASIFQVKSRPQDNPLIAHISNFEQLHQIAQDIPEEFFQLADAFFPGPLTVVLKRDPSVPASVSAGLTTIAVRMPIHPVARALIEALGQPLVAPSANLSGKPSSTKMQHVLEDFDGKIAAVIEGGDCRVGIESTVISLVAGPTPVILRPGVILKEQLEEVLGKAVENASSLSVVASPGMKYRHYAPRAKVKLFTDKATLLNHFTRPDQQMVVADELSAHTLYALLRLADERGVDEVLIYCDRQTLNDVALMDRLNKAASNFCSI